MDTSILKKAGLTESQAKGYLALIEHGALSPTELATHTEESRTNAYAIINKLVSYGLALQQEGSKNLYAAAHPVAIEALAERRRKAIVQHERLVKEGLPALIDLFYAHSETPGTRTVQGPDGIREIYKEMLQTRKDIYLLRTTADASVVGSDYLREHRDTRARLGIHTYAITPRTKTALKNSTNGTDTRLLFHRTFLPDGAYTSPVEIDVFGDTVALIAYGSTQIGTLITSPPIALAMRQVLSLLAVSLQAND